MKNKNTIISISKCPRCFKDTLEKRKYQIISDKIKKQPYYFSEWDSCTNCRFVQNYEDKKIFNQNDSGRYSRNLEELEGQTSFFSNL